METRVSPSATVIMAPTTTTRISQPLTMGPRACMRINRDAIAGRSAVPTELLRWPVPGGGAPSLLVRFSAMLDKTILRSGRLPPEIKLDPSFTLRPLSRQHRGDRTHQNLEIKRQAPVFHVFKIQLHTRFKGRIPARDDLPEPCNARFYLQPPVVLGTVSRAVVYGMGARANQAHIPLQDIPELRQFVETVLAKKASEPGNARIICDFKERVLALVELAQGISQSVSSIDHGPEFIANKSLSLFSCAEGGIDDLARRFQLDGQGNRKQEWPEEQKCDGGQQKIHDPLQEQTHAEDGARSRDAVASANRGFESFIAVNLGRERVQDTC